MKMSSYMTLNGGTDTGNVRERSGCDLLSGPTFPACLALDSRRPDRESNGQHRNAGQNCYNLARLLGILLSI